METSEFEQSVSRTLADATDMDPPQIGRLSGLLLSLHGVTADAVDAAWAELSKPDRIELATRVLELVLGR